MDNKKNTMNRKDFMIRSGAGLAGVGIAGCSKSLRKKMPGGSTVRYRILGNTGLKVSAVGFGGSRTDQPGVVKHVCDLGINLIDTGRMYANGRNEELIGKVIEDIRQDIIIQSKFYREYLTDAKQIEQSIDDSLKALRTDYIDIMLKQSAANKDELLAPVVLESLDKAKKAGKIRFKGFSTHSNQAEVLREAVKSGFYDVALVAYNHAGHYTHSVSKNFYEWDQAELEREIEKAVGIGMGVIAMKSCSAGPLKEDGGTEETYCASLRKTLGNKNISSVVPALANFKEIDENVLAMA